MHFRNISSLVLGLALIGILLACLPGPALAAAPPASWQISSVAEDIRYYPFASVAYGPDNVPHVVYRNNVTRNILHSWQPAGSGWNTEVIGQSAGYPQSPMVMACISGT